MPLPIVQQTIQARSSEKRGYRVFVSYSHNDVKDAKQFMKFFGLKLRGTPEVFITMEQVFFDREKLLAGEEWDDSIQRALEQVQYFILLVSANSLSSKYCFSRELTTAVARALPIIPILLNHCPWEEQPVPEDPKKRKLGDFGALPKDDRSPIRPIADWSGKDRAEAWTRVVKQLADRLLKDQAQPPSSTLAPERTAPTKLQLGLIPPLLPYFCNQKSTEFQFNRRVKAWSSSALLVLARGVYDDNVLRFWDRLRDKNLKDYLATLDSQLLEPRPLVWPFRADGAFDVNERTSAMMGALSESLVRNAFQLNDGVSLSLCLTKLSGVVPLVTALPKEKKKVIASGLRTLLGILEQCPGDTPLHRLVIAILIEDDDLVIEKNLIKALKLGGYHRTHLIDLQPLKEIGRDEIRDWHRECEVQKLCHITEENLLQTVLSGDPARSLRMRKFAEKVQEFL